MSPEQVGTTARADAQQASSLRRRFSRNAIGTNKLDLWRYEQDQLRTWRKFLPPWRRRAVGHQSNAAVAVRDKPFEPRDQTIAPAKGRVHPDKAVPDRGQAMGSDERIGRYPRRDLASRARHIHIETAAQRIKDEWWRIPFITGPNALLVQRHTNTRII